MIIDVHAHVGPKLKDSHKLAIYAGNEFGTVEDILRDMDRAGVDMAVTFGFLDLDTKYQADIQKRYPDRIISLAWVNPRLPNAAEEFRRAVEEWGIRGMKLHGWWHQFSLADHELLDPLCQICDEYKLPIVTHCMADGLTTPLQTEEMARAWPNVTFILSHLGGVWTYPDCIFVAKRTPNIMVDTATTESWWIRHFAKEVGPNRIMMGSDWPWNFLDAVVKTHEIAIPDQSEREWVMGRTAAKVFGIKV